MTAPEFPLLFVSPQNGLQLIFDEKILERASASSLLFPDKELFIYDGNGIKWLCSRHADSLKNTWLTRLLAKSIYDPLHKVSIQWVEEGKYELKDLKEELFSCIDADDDLITQFEEAEVIKEAILNASFFDQIVQALKKYVFAVDEKELWKEQEARRNNSL